MGTTTSANGTANGLEGVVVADTRLSEVDGERGRLIVAGHDVEVLAGKASFEQAVALLFDGMLPDEPRRAVVEAGIAAGRQRGFETLARAGDAFAARDAMDALRTAASHLRVDGDGEAAALQTIGALGTFAAAWARARGGQVAVPPDAGVGHAADVLRMVLGRPADSAARGGARRLPRDGRRSRHERLHLHRARRRLDAESISSRRSWRPSARSRARCTAARPGRCSTCSTPSSSPAERAAAWLEGELAAGRRIMGMGHRIYRVRDPRAAVLERAIAKLEARRRLAQAASPSRASVERAAEGVLRKKHPDRPLHANVEFYTAVLLDTIGLPRALFAAAFAVARVAGWCAHVVEQRTLDRLIRPSSRYVGPSVAPHA